MERPDHGAADCTNCQGTGQVRHERPEPGRFGIVVTNCWLCRGRGWVILSPLTLF